ncbi:RNA polymerase II subunit A C-terminal domain phosphatase isoform X1 [Gopherus evgoodei]|uniref:RNA polymerase II subunit A C-terminal domain phosphatase isoform X1 n=1 Tax=Gopherus evgoodei TaxID=1825980 RepID=UPI0011CF8718|nr:RNA polymerase II subunit A C-terminal domain phosphatase isoform X1 [Gopherus evgoodei]XP_030408455.1 RNA polymerase II subunit A C-terminal domain phosphatase isoform X1 [Gopherus evgoodei]XP_030408456.1 RNA polymerase II subunit A C-terminal domain phosphatase isoform X1 [Gopherus evgoodei]
MKGLCAECGQDLTQLQSKNGKQNVPLSTATVSMVHSVPELMVSSEQAEQLGREDQQRLHRNRKLVLMVDLDQTLIHTTEQHCQQMSNKGIFHFQLGRGEPMLHTRLRPHCKEFLEKIAKLYELHVFTFGSRLYAHTIAGFLDPEKKLFSHRILSRDECIDPFSKTGNLRNLFPCGDSMVCIIDDREDVWKFAPNLITVKKYVYFQGIGDINAPPGSREAQMKKKVNHSSKTTEASDPAVITAKDSEEAKNVTCIEEQSNGLGKSTKEMCTTNGSNFMSSETSNLELNSNDRLNVRDSLSGIIDNKTNAAIINDSTSVKESQISSEQDDRTVSEKQQTQDKGTNNLDFELSSDSESDSGLDARKSSSSSASDSENEGKRSWKKSEQPVPDENLQQECCTDMSGGKDGQVNHSEEATAPPSVCPHGKTVDLEMQEESEQDSLCDLGNGCADKKEAETESQNSEQSGITMGESLDQSMEEEEEEEDTDEDDHLIYLEEILVRVHTDYYTKYDKYLKQEISEIPDIRKIVPELKSKVLADVTIIFSGLYPTNFPIERTREHYHATALGAKIIKNLVLNADDPNKATHLIAARGGTEKVRQALDCKHLHVVNPDWLWSCLERWDKVEEQLFPLKDDYIKTQRENSPATFPDTHSTFQTALFHPTPIHPKFQPGPEVRLYDSNTGKLIRKGSQSSVQSLYIQSPAPPLTLPVHGEHSSFRVVQPHQQQLFDEEELPADENEDQPGPSKRKRQPSMSETMPLYTLCKEDLESMDKEVDDILGEGSDDSDSEKKKTEEEGEKPQSSATESLGMKIEERPGSSSSSSERSLTGSVPRNKEKNVMMLEELSQILQRTGFKMQTQDMSGSLQKGSLPAIHAVQIWMHSRMTKVSETEPHLEKAEETYSATRTLLLDFKQIFRCSLKRSIFTDYCFHSLKQTMISCCFEIRTTTL